MRRNCLIYRAVHKCKSAGRTGIYICQWLHLQAFTNVLFHVERIYKCNHAGGQAGQDRRAPPRAGEGQRGPAPQGPGKNKECLPPRAGEEQRVPAPKGLGRVGKWRRSVAESPLTGPSQALGIDNRAACRASLQALFVLPRPLG